MNNEHGGIWSGGRKNTAKSASKSGLQLKGTYFGIRVIFPEDLADDPLLKIFAAVPKEAYVLPVGSGVVLDFQARPCSENFIIKVLREVVWPKKLNVLAWLTSDKDSSKRLSGAGFRVTEPIHEHAGAAAAQKSPKSVIVAQSFRAGRREEYAGDVILVGHLNDGAELFAGGSVFVLGKLKGLVHAGCSGVDGVCVAAASLETRQLRIGDKLCDQFGSDMKWWKKPVIITLEDSGLLVREWPPGA